MAVAKAASVTARPLALRPCVSAVLSDAMGHAGWTALAMYSFALVPCMPACSEPASDPLGTSTARHPRSDAGESASPATGRRAQRPPVSESVVEPVTIEADDALVGGGSTATVRELKLSGAPGEAPSSPSWLREIEAAGSLLGPRLAAPSPLPSDAPVVLEVPGVGEWAPSTSYELGMGEWLGTANSEGDLVAVGLSGARCVRTISHIAG